MRIQQVNVQFFKRECLLPMSDNDGRSTTGYISRLRTGLSVAGVALLLSACGQPENPQLAMCQSVTKNLLGDVEWGENSVNESTNRMTINASYTSDGSSGKVSCMYPRERLDDGNGKFATAPESVKINGERVSTGDLIRAGTKASKSELQAVAKETARQGEIVAQEVGQKADELAGQAEVLANEAGQKLGDAAGQAGKVAGELGQQAQEAAQNAVGKVKQAMENQ